MYSLKKFESILIQGKLNKSRKPLLKDILAMVIFFEMLFITQLPESMNFDANRSFKRFLSES